MELNQDARPKQCRLSQRHHRSIADGMHMISYRNFEIRPVVKAHQKWEKRFYFARLRFSPFVPEGDAPATETRSSFPIADHLGSSVSRTGR